MRHPGHSGKRIYGIDLWKVNMTKPITHHRSRRRFLKTVAATGVAAAPLLALTSRDASAAKARHLVVQYRDKPRNGNFCAQCKYFEAAGPVGNNQCQIVKSPIASKGWCSVFHPRS